MRAVIASGAGGPEVLSVGEVPEPTLRPGEVLVDVVATAVNRADTLQRMGFYPVPEGSSEIIGLECSGTIAALGRRRRGLVRRRRGLRPPDRWWVRRTVAVPVGQLMPVPAGVSLVDAAALPEVACTVWSNVFMVAGLQPRENFLVHGGAGGIGTMAIQLATALSAKVFATAGSAEKLAVCADLGADVPINYRDEDFVAVLTPTAVPTSSSTTWARSTSPATSTPSATSGRLVIIGMMGGTKAELDINALLRKRGAVIATALRSRPPTEKAAICAEVVEHVWPLVAEGAVIPVIHERMPLEDVEPHTG